MPPFFLDNLRGLIYLFFLAAFVGMFIMVGETGNAGLTAPVTGNEFANVMLGAALMTCSPLFIIALLLGKMLAQTPKPETPVRKKEETLTVRLDITPKN